VKHVHKAKLNTLWILLRCTVSPITRHEDTEGEYRQSFTMSLTSAWDAGEWLTPRPGRFTPGNDPVSNVRILVTCLKMRNVCYHNITWWTTKGAPMRKTVSSQCNKRAWSTERTLWRTICVCVCPPRRNHSKRSDNATVFFRRDHGAVAWTVHSSTRFKMSVLREGRGLYRAVKVCFDVLVKRIASILRMPVLFAVGLYFTPGMSPRQSGRSSFCLSLRCFGHISCG
jgi:hypothetical protein